MKITHAILVFMAAFLIHSNSLFSQNEKKPLVGVWQRIVLDSEDVVGGEYTLFFKILSADGTFANLQISTSGKAFYAHRGTYQITSDSTFVESISSSSYEGYVGTESLMRYKLEKENRVLQTQWCVEQDTWIPETWAKVKELPGNRDSGAY